MSPSLYVRQLLREARGSLARALFFVTCLAVGVGAIVAVAALSSGLEEGIRGQSRQLLTADLAVEGRRPIPEPLAALLQRPAGAAVTRIKEMATVVAAPASGATPGRSQLVELKAIERGYPFYGELGLDPPGALEAMLGGGAVAAAPDLLTRLGLKPGDRLLVGGEPFLIAGTVTSEPDRIGGAFSLGPRLFVSLSGLARTGLEQFGSRISHRLLVKLPPEAALADLEALTGEVKSALREHPGYRVETFEDAQPGLRDGLQRVSRFLGLVALLSLLLGGIGIAETTQAWLAGRTDAIATLRCLGMRPREVVALYLGQMVWMGLTGSLLGAAAGLLTYRAALGAMKDFLPVAGAPLWQPGALLRGLAMGLAVALLFSLTPLMATRRVPPLRVLRKDVEGLPPPRATRWLTAALVVGGTILAASTQARSLRWGALFTLGTAAAGLILAVAARLVTGLLARLPRDLGRVWLRHGLAAGGRPGSSTRRALVALGLGVVFILATVLVEEGLAGGLLDDLPEEAPTAFLIDIQPDQWASVQRLLESNGASRIDSVPVVNARLSKIGGEPVRFLATSEEGDRGRRWALTRQQRLTYLQELPEGNRLVAGELWSLPEPEISVEEEFAADLGVTLGSKLLFDVQGVPIEMVVSSLRSVEWRTFGINFFLIAEPGVLDQAPQLRLAAARLPRTRETEIQDLLAAAFPNVTVIKVRAVLEKIAEVLGRLARGVRFLGGFTVAAGIVILGGALSASMIKRRREIALLKTLGMTRWQILGMLFTEYSLTGLVAGLIGCAGASLLSWVVLTRGLELSWRLHPGILAAGLVATLGLTLLAGLVVSWSGLRQPPAEVLRGEG